MYDEIFAIPWICFRRNKWRKNEILDVKNSTKNYNSILQQMLLPILVKFYIFSFKTWI